ncbi:MAG: DUF2975 domain-containing protein [Anaerolineales bacterium]|nr:DUF2975 domain-containing protein [Anaerolineales bacterium]MCK4977990.1 DUF2975 domain-containing protein [Anaerolineales bacterium]MCK5313488.1 DUF2975 domain-containing protein [Anaerolineales bacterium]
MSTSNNKRLIRVTKFVVDLIFFLLVGVSIFLALWIALSPLILKATDAPITASVPVAIGAGFEPQISVEVAGSETKGISAAFVDEAQGILRLETTNWTFIAISNLAKLLTAIGLAYVFYLLRAILQAIKQGDPFVQDNVIRMRRMGWAVLIVGFLRPTVEYFATWTILNQLTIVEPPLSLPSPFQSEVILASLLILILAQVWSYGLKIERDSALTI